MQQLVFNFTLTHKRDNYHHIAYFVAGQNDGILGLFREWLASDQGHAYVFGAHLSGCSRLLRAACHARLLAGEKVAHLTNTFDLMDALATDMASNHQLIAVDNLECVSGIASNQELLYELFDRAADKHCKLLFGAHLPYTQLDCDLPDLRTRLASCLQIGLQPLEDEALVQLAEQLLKECGIAQLPTGIGELVIERIQRDSASLVATIRTMQRQSITQKKPITLEFVRRYLRMLK